MESKNQNAKNVVAVGFAVMERKSLNANYVVAVGSAVMETESLNAKNVVALVFAHTESESLNANYVVAVRSAVMGDKGLNVKNVVLGSVNMEIESLNAKNVVLGSVLMTNGRARAWIACPLRKLLAKDGSVRFAVEGLPGMECASLVLSPSSLQKMSQLKRLSSSVSTVS